jgi:hypothetical protein
MTLFAPVVELCQSLTLIVHGSRSDRDSRLWSHAGPPWKGLPSTAGFHAARWKRWPRSAESGLPRSGSSPAIGEDDGLLIYAAWTPGSNNG